MRKVTRLLAVFTTLLLSVLLTSCDPVGIDRASQRVQQAIDQLARESQAWQQTLKDLERDLIQQGQSTIATEVTQLLQRGIATGGNELRCGADFIGQRMKEGLERIRDALRRTPPQPLKQFFCQVIPESVNLSLEENRRNSISFYGYNLDAARAKVQVRTNTGALRDVPNSPTIIATPTHYLMTLNLSPVNGLQISPADQQIVFILNGGLPSQESHAVNIIAVPRPQSFAVRAARRVVAGGGGIGRPFKERLCPSARVGTGIRGYGDDDFVRQFQLVCAPLNANGTLGAVTSVEADGRDKGSAFEINCPAGQVIVGMSGNSSGNVHRIALQCKTPADIVGVTGSVNSTAAAGGNGGAPFSAACSDGEAMTGFRVASYDERITRLDGHCSLLALE